MNHRHVYCKNCMFFKVSHSDWGSSEWCKHPSNIRIDYRHQGPVTKHLAEPSVKNSDARCADYLEKPKKNWKRFFLQTVGLGWS